MNEKQIVARFYQSNTGACPVLEWLRGLPVGDRQAIGKDLARVEFGWPVGMPICRALGNGLWEVRSTLPSRRIARLIFCLADGELFVLHGFIKKSQQTPAPDSSLAQKRRKEIEL
jgi:phage-related protein